MNIKTCHVLQDCVSADVPVTDWSSSPDVPADAATDYHDIGMPIICSVCCTGSLCNSGGCGHAREFYCVCMRNEIVDMNSRQVNKKHY
jgi:hypothetical protein